MTAALSISPGLSRDLTQSASRQGSGLPKTMSAVKKLRAGPGLDFCTDVPVPAVGPRDVLIAVTHAGICGTDRHIYEWDAWSQSRVKVGITTGHELVGRVVQAGSAVT